jgi:hypothetical protein
MREGGRRNVYVCETERERKTRNEKEGERIGM